MKNIKLILEDGTVVSSRRYDRLFTSSPNLEDAVFKHKENGNTYRVTSVKYENDVSIMLNVVDISKIWNRHYILIDFGDELFDVEETRHGRHRDTYVEDMRTGQLFAIVDRKIFDVPETNMVNEYVFVTGVF